MEIFATGLNYKTAPVEIERNLPSQREKYSEILEKISLVPSIYEVSILSTCNRVELYGLSDSVEEAFEEILRILSSYSGLKVGRAKKVYVHLYRQGCYISYI
ncbi:MAG: hypothetical protein Q9M89_00305 [Persephonella sp.]|nr:hypothetical protein [Persephonella sp.]